MKYKQKTPVYFNVALQYIYSSVTYVKLNVKLHLDEWAVNSCCMKYFKFTANSIPLPGVFNWKFLSKHFFHSATAVSIPSCPGLRPL